MKIRFLGPSGQGKVGNGAFEGDFTFMFVIFPFSSFPFLFFL